jgi:hypothetical protein
MIPRYGLTLVSGPDALAAMLGIAAGLTRGYGMPTSSGKTGSGRCLQGMVLLVSDQEHAWRQLSAAGVHRELSSVLEVRDHEGKVRALTLADLPLLAETLERRHPTLAIMAGLPPSEAGLIAALADLAEQHACALVAVSDEPVAHELEKLAHTALRTFERESGRYVLRRGLRHVASRIGPRGESIAFGLHGDIVSWEGIVEELGGPELDDPEPHSVSRVSSVECVPAAEPHGCGSEAQTKLDAESAFLLEQLAAGPMRARDVQHRGAERGYGVRELRRRAEALGILRQRSPRGVWMWARPADPAR